MIVKTVRKHHDPNYPTRPIADDHPEILRWVPCRWRANPVVLAALSSLLALSSGAKSANADQKDPKNTSLVAPLFIHGSGRGSFGCRVTNPPVFLSEAEARNVIRDEAKKAGIYFRGDRSKVRSLTVDVYDKHRNETKTKPLTVDGKDRGKDISFVFVSSTDTFSGEGFIVVDMDAKKVADDFSKKISLQKPAGVYGVFYEPFTYPDEHAKDEDSAQKEAIKTNKQELRKQVQDFLKWLKAEGVI